MDEPTRGRVGPTDGLGAEATLDAAGVFAPASISGCLTTIGALAADTRVVNTSLDGGGASFSRASKVELASKRVDTGALVAEIRAELDAQNRGTPVTWEVGALPGMLGDPAMLRLVWVNLLSNAVKYSSKSAAPRVEVGFGDAHDPDAFYVRDNGAGFDMRYADKLFGVFQLRRLHAEHPLWAQSPVVFGCPQSGHAGIADAALERAHDDGRVRALAYSEEAGYSIFESGGGQACDPSSTLCFEHSVAVVIQAG